MNISSPPDITDTSSSHKHTSYLSVITACLKYYVFFCYRFVSHGSCHLSSSPGLILFRNLSLKNGSPIFRLKISLDEKILYFIFVLFFLGHPRHPPSELKKNHFAGVWNIQVSRQSRSQRQSTSLVNLRSGSIFVSLWKLHCGGQGETKRENFSGRR